MLVQRLFNDQLAQASYLVVCQHARVALVVDPNRDIDRYVDAAAAEGVRITHVTETHIHADFVSGARELASRTGAELLLSDAGGPDWKYAFAAEANAELLTDGSHFMVGDVRIDAVHTPGHTPEHLSFLVTDTAVSQKHMGALTGDFIFVGDVGRPDLLERAAGYAGTMEDSAQTLFECLKAFSSFPDYLQIWPGHGAGSACGKALGAMPQSTLGYEKLYNWAFAEQDRDRFVAQALTGQPEPPAYFALMKQVNRDGPPAAMLHAPPSITAKDLAARISRDETVVDTRSAADYASRHASGTVNIPRNKSFLTWAGALLPYDSDVYLIIDGEDGERAAVAKELSLIGLDRIGGALPTSSLGLLADSGAAMTGIDQVTVAEFAGRRDGVAVVDVRAKSEWDDGHLPGAIHIPLASLQSRLSEIPGGEVVVHCQGGGRSAIAASILERSGRTDVANLTGGFSEWSRSGNPVARDPLPGRT